MRRELFAVFVALAVVGACAASDAPSRADVLRKTRMMMADAEFRDMLVSYERTAWSPRPRSGVSDTKVGMHMECALCGMALNEVAGLLTENITMSDLEQKIDQDICSHLDGSLKVLCEGFVGDLPVLVKEIEARYEIPQTCVRLGFCEAPIDDHHPETMDMPVYQINLDEAPIDRFTEVCSNATFVKTMTDMVDWVAAGLSDKGAKIQEFGRLINSLIDTEYAQEIQGCAKAMDLDYGWLTFLNIGYEVSDACTSFLVQSTDGTVMHFRNLDFWAGMSFSMSLRNMSYIGEYMTGGKMAYRISGLAGYQGALSGMNAGFATTIDTRFYPNGILNLLDEIVVAMEEKDATLVAFLTRDVLASGADFATAVEKLSSAPLIADVYYTVSGVAPGEGAIIARNRTGVFNMTRLGVDEFSGENWWVAVTNYNWALPQPWIDNRLDPLKDRLTALGQQHATVEALGNLLIEKPTLNLQTVQSFIGIPKNQTYHGWTRTCPWPCAE